MDAEKNMKANGLIAKLNQELRGEAETPPEGYKSASEVAKEDGVSERRAHDVLRKAHVEGLVDRVKVRGPYGHLVSYYKVK